MPKSTKKKGKKRQQKRAAKRGRAPRRSVGFLRDAVSYSNLVARTIALPSDYPPLRVPSINSTQKTAVVSLNAATQSQPVPSGSQRWMLINSPTTPVWTDCSIDGDLGRNVSCIAGTRTATYTANQTVFMGTIIGGSISTTAGPDFEEYVTSSTTPDYTSPTLPPLGFYNGRQFFYVASNENIGVGIVLTPVGANPLANPVGSATATLEYITPKGVVDFELPLAPNGVSGLGTGPIGWGGSIPAPGNWWRLRDVRAATDTTNFTAVNAGSYDIQFDIHLYAFSTGQQMMNNTVATTAVKFRPWPAARCIEGTTPVIYDACRITAASLRLTNVTALLKQEGSIYAARLNSRTVNVFNFDASSFSTVPVSEKHNLTLQKGLYTYLAPGDDLQFKEHLTVCDPNIGSGGSPIIPLLHLDDMRMVNCAIVGDPDVTTTSQLNVTFDMHLEFMSGSQLFPPGVTLVSPLDYSAAVTALCTTGYFFENPSHYAALARLVLNGLKVAWPVLRQSAAVGLRAGGAHMFTTLGKAMTSRLEQHL